MTSCPEYVPLPELKIDCEPCAFCTTTFCVNACSLTTLAPAYSAKSRGLCSEGGGDAA